MWETKKEIMERRRKIEEGFDDAYHGGLFLGFIMFFIIVISAFTQSR